MPDIVTHARFALDVLERLPKEVTLLTKEHINTILLAAQGPDPFFYNNFQPWKDRKETVKIAKTLHEKKTNLFFNTFLQELSSSPDKTFTSDFSFLIGLITHYALDTVTHPYIFHFTALYDENDETTHKYRGNHLRFERSIDSIFIKKYWNIKPSAFKVHKEILGIKRVPLTVSIILERTLKKVYNIEDAGHKYTNAVKDMKSYFKLFIKDRIGSKKVFLGLVDKYFNTKGDIKYKTMSYYNNIEDIDYFNEKKVTWTHPCDENEVSNETFWDLYEKAINVAVDLITKTYDYFTEESITGVDYGNLSYSTGKNCEEDLPMKHFNSIY